MADTLASLAASVARLRSIVDRLTGDDLTTQAYPTEWTIADVLSHVGSGAVIMRRGLIDTVAGVATPADFNQSVWDEWNAKTPAAKAVDALTADANLMDALGAVTAEQRESARFAIGPMQLEFEAFAQLRLNEHALHTWDVEVVGDPSAIVPAAQTDVIIDNLFMIAGWVGKVAGETRTVTIATQSPSRHFTLAVGPERVALSPSDLSDSADATLPAEAFIRLVYGRLDAAHTPADVVGGAVLDGLRQVFPGF